MGDIAFPHPEGFVDIAQCLSLLNRRAYRQGMEYYVDSWTLQSSVPCQAYIVTLSESWVNTNAWTKAFRTWLSSQEQLDNFDEIKGRYHDFKVYMTHTHANSGVADNLLPNGYVPGDVAGISATAGAQWDASQIVIPNDGAVGVVGEYQLHMVGADGLSKGIVGGYADSRARPQLDDPNVVEGSSWMVKAFDTGDNFEAITDDVQDKNDSPPYFIDEDTDFEFYPGGSNASNGAGAGTTIQGTLNINPVIGSFTTKTSPGFVAPCGLVLIVGPNDVDYTVTLNVALGPYKGVMARPMQDVN